MEEFFAVISDLLQPIEGISQAVGALRQLGTFIFGLEVLQYVPAFLLPFLVFCVSINILVWLIGRKV